MQRERVEHLVSVISEGNADVFEIVGGEIERLAQGFFDVLCVAIAQDGKKHGLLFEFKRVPPNQLTFKDIMINKKKKSETRFVAGKIASELENNDILCYPVARSDGPTVADVVAGAKEEVRHAVAAIASHNLSKLRCFAVVSVATELIVEKA
jgi:hypothetical protein